MGGTPRSARTRWRRRVVRNCPMMAALCSTVAPQRAISGELGVMCPCSVVRAVWEPTCWFSVAVSTIARLPELVAPAVTHRHPRLAGIGAWFSALFGAIWPDQRHIQAARDTPRSTLVAPLLALGLPALGSSVVPLWV